LPSGIRAGSIKMQAFAGGEQSTGPDGINKENIAAGDSAKLTQ